MRALFADTEPILVTRGQNKGPETNLKSVRCEADGPGTSFLRGLSGGASDGVSDSLFW